MRKWFISTTVRNWFDSIEVRLQFGSKIRFDCSKKSIRINCTKKMIQLKRSENSVIRLQWKWLERRNKMWFLSIVVRKQFDSTEWKKFNLITVSNWFTSVEARKQLNWTAVMRWIQLLYREKESTWLLFDSITVINWFDSVRKWFSQSVRMWSDFMMVMFTGINYCLWHHQWRRGDMVCNPCSLAEYQVNYL